MMILELIVQQYQQQCSETGFEPMSKRTLHRVLYECSQSARKALPGLDNFPAQGTRAFNSLDKLVDCGKIEVWATEMKQQLCSLNRVPTQYSISLYT
ncbi:hypothetical protein P5673_021737 [Acropora cervicornis]|uniref:Uncharacterized protein n=1 Tax=Acropora cervicornis TaxID=6130 RepID=A0AAD9Q7K1_ACRCE|nr:hypothetical protein P5673_021737 [Acropora cervicornis]